LGGMEVRLTKYRPIVPPLQIRIAIARKKPSINLAKLATIVITSTPDK